MFINEVEIRTNPAGMVLYMSDWLQCDEFARLGYFRHVHDGRGTYADEFFFVTPMGHKVSSEQASEPFVPFGAN